MVFHNGSIQRQITSENEQIKDSSLHQTGICPCEQGADQFLRVISKERRRKIEETRGGEVGEDRKERETAVLSTTLNIPIRPSYRSLSWGRVSPFTRKKSLDTQIGI